MADEIRGLLRFFCLVGEKWAFHYGGGQVVTFAEVLIFSSVRCRPRGL